jgi:hypothetical protein
MIRRSTSKPKGDASSQALLKLQLPFGLAAVCHGDGTARAESAPLHGTLQQRSRSSPVAGAPRRRGEAAA